MNAIWLVMVALGLLTYLTRLSFVLLLERWQPPELVRRALRYVPLAVLTAIILPDLLLANGSLHLSLGNPRLLAGLAAILVAWRTRSALWSIGVGMGLFLLLNGFLP